ncbi:MAG: hypothetical protein ABF806_04295 [Bifidobacterium psychraerophilum]|uniref:hypothetical protein n=1 Tax=Bifidobacterium psychraerophilum TaxID=218140 RepID=UPI0039E7E0A8
MMNDKRDEDTIRLGTVADEDIEDTVSMESTSQTDDGQEGQGSSYAQSADTDASRNHPGAGGEASQDAPTAQQASASQQGVPLYAKPAPDGSGEFDAHGNRIVRKRGASMATIVFGSMLIVCGVIGFGSAWYGPGTLWSSFGLDWRMALALALAAIGAVLLVSSMMWALSSVIRAFARHDDEGRPQG